MMAGEEHTTIPPATEWTYRSDADQQRAVDALLRDPLWSLLGDEAIASIAEAGPDLVSDKRLAIGGIEPPSTNGEGGLLLPWSRPPPSHPRQRQAPRSPPYGAGSGGRGPDKHDTEAD
jgi:hypothetical protein